MREEEGHLLRALCELGAVFGSVHTVFPAILFSYQPSESSLSYSLFYRRWPLSFFSTAQELILEGNMSSGERPAGLTCAGQ